MEEFLKNKVGRLLFYVNGEKIEVEEADPEWTLLYYLRTILGLKGSKLGCGEGGCGACTVMLSKVDRNDGKVYHYPVNACLMPVCAVHGTAITTVEGIGPTARNRLHPAQARLIRAHGSQCGFCTPGIIMSMYALLRQSAQEGALIADHQLEAAFQGNLCRCTGYRPIIQGYRTFLAGHPKCPLGKQCCQVRGNICNDKPTAEETEEKGGFDDAAMCCYDGSQEPIFPPELQLNWRRYHAEELAIRGPYTTWYRPTSLEQLLLVRRRFPDAKIVVGNTEIGVEIKLKHRRWSYFVDPTGVAEMTRIDQINNEGVKIGAAVTLDVIDRYLRRSIINNDSQSYRIRNFEAIVDILQYFAGKQIRSVGTLGGNIATGSPISDLLPILMATRCVLQVVRHQQPPDFITMDQRIYKSYRTPILPMDALILDVLVPFTDRDQYVCAFKQARRRDDDIAIVNMCVSVTFETALKGGRVRNASIYYGGMNWRPVEATKTQQFLCGKPWNRDTLEKAYGFLLEDLPLPLDAPGGMARYRVALALGLFLKAYLRIAHDCGGKDLAVSAGENVTFESLSHALPPPKFSQFWAEGATGMAPVQRPLLHSSAVKHATGEAIYCDDIPSVPGQLYMAFVLSKRAHARIISVDTQLAFHHPGIVCYLSGDDLPVERNRIGSIVHDEQVFYSQTVTSYGQAIGAIVATDQAVARRAAHDVHVVYEDLEPTIVTIEDAIRHESYFAERKLECGDVDVIFNSVAEDSAIMLEGTVRSGGQDHFYLEAHCALAIPLAEDGEMEVYSSTQNPSETSAMIARVLGTDQNRIYTRVKRIGGGFGGKESRALLVAVPVAVAAHKLRRPVRCMLERDEDMLMTGGRHPFFTKYRVAFNKLGEILACDVQMYSNAGYSLDLSTSVMERAMTHFSNVYRVPAVRVVGRSCRTNLPSNTAFRGFGGPQGMFVGEWMVRHIADHLDIDVMRIVELNMYRDGDLTFYKQTLTGCTVSKCWRKVIEDSAYAQRRIDCDRFNATHQYRKRGICAVPSQYGIAFTAIHLNQAGALVLVYTDGSVLLTHGGIEMGQGLYIKMLQVAAKCLGIPIEWIHHAETANDKVANAGPTAASSGSDLNGMAVVDACQTIMARLKPYQVAKPDAGWRQWVRSAYFDRVNLAAYGFYRTPHSGYDWQRHVGTMYNYYTCGAAVCEVEIDTLTGDHRVLRVDIVMDLGASLNPAIDVGQIEGAFTQGYGLFMLEELLYAPNGAPLTLGPGAYKLPGFGDIPGELHVTLLQGEGNPRAVFSSKAVGEPPLFLGSSPLFAVVEAIKAARGARSPGDHFKLDAPASCDKIRMLCEDHITSLLRPEDPPGTFQPWCVKAQQ